MNLNIKLNKYRSRLNEEIIDTAYDDDSLAPVMPAIDVVQQLMDEEERHGRKSGGVNNKSDDKSKSDIHDDLEPGPSHRPDVLHKPSTSTCSSNLSQSREKVVSNNVNNIASRHHVKEVKEKQTERKLSKDEKRIAEKTSQDEDEDISPMIRLNPFNNFLMNHTNEEQRKDEYELIPKSVILDVYSNDPEVKRFLRQLSKIFNESGYNDQDYKCYSCRRPIGLVFGQSRLCHFDGHQYCTECHLNEKSVIPARILCNWDFNKYPVSKRNQHFLNLISNESMFEIKKLAPLLYKMCPELREIEELRHQAFFIRSYCTNCVQDSISFELTKLIWPREHLVKQTDIYSLEDLVQIKSGALKQVLKNVIVFGRQHVLSCVLCRQKGFICELCKSSHIIYPFDTDSVHRCNECQSIYHKSCFKSRPIDDGCPRCQRLLARRNETSS